MFRFFIGCLLAANALALPVEELSVLGAPSVEIRDGTVRGSTLLGVDSFKGIPFAQPPVGHLRLKSPQPLNSSYGTIDAVGVEAACPQFYAQVKSDKLLSNVLGSLLNTPLLQQVTKQDEDCLTVNVQRPSNVDSETKLPVLFWIYGGGFEFGGTQLYDGTSIVQRSITNNEPVIFVAVNYRVGGHGWLAGKELAKEGSTNLGLRDQRLALEWVADNIEAFGGDPSKVTIWGESAGSISVMAHTIINGGNNTYKGKPLFRAGIMNSGSFVPAQPVTAPKAQAIYDRVVKTAGCSTSNNTLSCLRSLSSSEFLHASSSVPHLLGPRSLDLSYLPRPDPNDAFFPESPEIPLKEGRYTKMPIIIGDQEDEGTLFSLAPIGLFTDAKLKEYLVSFFAGTDKDSGEAEKHISALLSEYPNKPLLGQPAGSPFNTGLLNNIYPQFKRLAAFLGDHPFTMTRRVYLEHITKNSNVPAWSYLATYFHGTPIMGTFHASDLLHSFGLLPGLLLPTRTIQNYFLNFANHMDPNKGIEKDYLIDWPQWENETRELCEFGALENGVMDDTFRQGVSDYLGQNIEGIRI